MMISCWFYRLEQQSRDIWGKANFLKKSINQSLEFAWIEVFRDRLIGCICSFERIYEPNSDVTCKIHLQSLQADIRSSFFNPFLVRSYNMTDDNLKLQWRLMGDLHQLLQRHRCWLRSLPSVLITTSLQIVLTFPSRFMFLEWLGSLIKKKPSVKASKTDWYLMSEASSRGGSVIQRFLPNCSSGVGS